MLEAYTFSYDEMGDCVSQTKTSVTPNEVTEYEYYVGGNLKKVTLPDATEIEYLYDANSNRIQKTNATEIIDYHYSGSELKSEVHKNKQNTVLYTLTYYPYGFSKTVGQTTTSYYYIYDNRGFVWALTDDGGDIVETYDYSPYGELLSTPSITNHLFLSGADQCVYDEETSMAHLNNRYYIPKIGRFLQRDSVEGSPTSTISQNLYTYCQNSPITLVDPSGNSPQNTGTPPRTETVNAAAFSGDLSCYMPDMNKALTLCGTETIKIDEGFYEAANADAFGEYSACGGVVTDVTDQYDQPLGGGRINVYEIQDPAGNKVRVTVRVDKNGNKTVVAETTSKNPSAGEKALADGLNDGFNDIVDRGGNLSDFDIGQILKDVENYASTNLRTWGKIYTPGIGESSNRTFFKHAVVGGAIKQAMADDARYTNDVGQYDMDIGFWTSYYVSVQEGLPGGVKKKWYSDLAWDAPSKTVEVVGGLGIVDIARLGKAIMVHENNNANLDPNAYNDKNDDHSTDWGLMSLNDKTKDGFPGTVRVNNNGYFTKLQNITKNDMWKSNPFVNIGGGIGTLFDKYSEEATSNTLDFWMKAVAKYNGSAVGDPYQVGVSEKFMKNYGKRKKRNTN